MRDMHLLWAGRVAARLRLRLPRDICVPRSSHTDSVPQGESQLRQCACGIALGCEHHRVGRQFIEHIYWQEETTTGERAYSATLPAVPLLTDRPHAILVL